MRVLVTGSTGLIGRALVNHLGSAGHEPVGLSRAEVQATAGEHVAADIGRPGLARALERVPRCEAIVHAAATIDLDGPAHELALTNCFGTQQVLELAARWEVQSFVFLSSVPVIGTPVTLPITEEHPVAPRTAYHASKLFGEHLVEIAARQGIAAASLRVSAPIGRGMPAGRLLAVFVESALAGAPLRVAGAGTRGQDFVDARDVAAAATSCVELRTDGLINIASGRTTTNLDLARRCVEVLGSSSEVRSSGADPEEGVRWEVSIERAAATLGYAPRHSLAESIAWIAAERGVIAGG